MTAYSISAMAGIGTVTDEDVTKDAGLFQMPMPGSDSSSAVMFDIFGASRTIKISGTFTVGDSGYATLALFIAALDALVDGSQTVITYTSGKSGSTYNVMVMDVNWKSEVGGVNKVDYNITMVEGSS